VRSRLIELEGGEMRKRRALLLGTLAAGFALALATGDCPGNQIAGPVSITGSTTGTDFSGNAVYGPATLTNDVGRFVFGDLVANTIYGSVTTSGNA
jgi:hypothetical protein